MDKQTLESIQVKINSISEILASISDDIHTIQDDELKDELSSSWLGLLKAKGSMSMVIRTAKKSKENVAQPYPLTSI